MTFIKILYSFIHPFIKYLFKTKSAPRLGISWQTMSSPRYWGYTSQIKQKKIPALVEIIFQQVHGQSLQSCRTLCNPMDCSLPGSSVHGILQARILQWVTMLSSRRSFQPRDQTTVSYVSFTGKWDLYHQRRLGSPILIEETSN